MKIQDEALRSPLTGKSWSTGGALTPRLRGKISIFSLMTVQGGTNQESTGYRKSGAAVAGSCGHGLHPGARDVSQPSVHRHC